MARRQEMAAVENDDLSGLSDRSLRSRIKQARKDFHKLEKRPVTQEVIEEMQKQTDRVTAAEKELRTRQYGRFAEQLPSYRALKRARRDKVESRASETVEHAAARKALGMTGGPPGARVDPTRLSREQGEELFAIARKLFAQGLSDEEEARRRALICVAANDPDLFERDARERALREKEAKIRDEQRIDSVPERAYTGRGLAVLPPYLAGWLLDGKESSLDVFKLGVLSGILLGLENHLPTLIGARIDDLDGEAVMVAPSQPLRLDPQAGSRAVGHAVDYLAQNELLSVERGPEGLRIAAGERIKNLRNEARANRTSAGRESSH
jgi:hypothetical protein